MLLSYFLVPLDEKTWQLLTRLQRKYRNLSNESQSCILTVDMITKQGLKTFAGHDRTLQRFWQEHGLKQAKKIPLFEEAEVEFRGTPLESYYEYLEHYVMTG